MNPDRAADEEMLHSAAQRVDKMFRALRRVADHVNHDIRVKLLNLQAECPFMLRKIAMNGDLLDFVPRLMRLIRLAFAATD